MYLPRITRYLQEGDGNIIWAPKIQDANLFSSSLNALDCYGVWEKNWSLDSRASITIVPVEVTERTIFEVKEI